MAEISEAKPAPCRNVPSKPFSNIFSRTLMKEVSAGISFKFTTSTKNTLFAK